MKSSSLPTACAFLACLLSGAASASGPCYTVYGKDNTVVYRSEESPIDLSRPIHLGMAKRFPNGHLVMQAGIIDCPKVLPSGTQAGTSGIGPDDSPALKLPTPFGSAQAADNGTVAVAAVKRKRARKAVAASAAASVQTTPVAALPVPQRVDIGAPTAAVNADSSSGLRLAS